MHYRRIQAARARVEAQLDTAKRAIAKDISKVLADRQLTQTAASHLTGEAPSQISLVCSGKLRGFSMERLLRLRALLGAALSIEVTESHRPVVSFAVA